MPALCEIVTEDTVTRWLKSVGDDVSADEPLLEVSTDKVDTEIPSPASGTLLEITVGEDETVEVGAQLAVIGSGAAGGGESAAPAPAPPQQAAPPQQEERPAPPEQTLPEPEADYYGSGGGQPAEPASASAQAAPAQAPAPAQASAPTQAPAPAAAPSAGVDGSGTYVTPLVRRLAAEHG